VIDGQFAIEHSQKHLLRPANIRRKIGMGTVKGIKKLSAATTWSSQPSFIPTIQADIDYLKGLITLQ
jgi:hypothetical protein